MAHIHRLGQHYSEGNPIPTFKQFLESLDRDKKQRDADIAAQLGGAKAGGRHSTGRRRSEVSDHRPGRTSTGKHRRVVTDPVTGRSVQICDMDAATLEAARHPLLSVPNACLGKDATVQTTADQQGETYRRNQDLTAPPDPVAPGATSDVPIRGEKTNVLFHPTPSLSYEPMFAALEARALMLSLGIFVAVVVVGSSPLFGVGGRLLGLVPLAAVLASAVFLWTRDVVRRGRDLEWASERERGRTAIVNLIPESAEWLNEALAVAWQLANPEMLASVADTLEDVMQASVPALVENVKIADFSQGSNPLRLLSLRALPDRDAADLEADRRRHAEEVARKDPDEMAADAAGGRFFNLEATVAYHAAPKEAEEAEGGHTGVRRNLGMQLVFFLGVRRLFGVPLPVWVELHGLVCTVRLRVALAPAPPFVTTVSATLMGLPHVEVGCVPLVERGANILNLPIIASFVRWAVAATAGMYVAPRSLTLDIGQLLAGDGLKHDTAAHGVLLVRIRRAVGLSKQDRRVSDLAGGHGRRNPAGGSDPYICVAFSKFGKPQYCTRVIEDDRNPVFEETAALLVTDDVLQADEKLSLELWDSDRSSSDDLVGKVELSITDLMRRPGRMMPQVSRLAGASPDSEMPGELHWEVGYFGKVGGEEEEESKDKSKDKEGAVNKEEEGKEGTVNKKEEGKEGAKDKEERKEGAKDKHDANPDQATWPSGILSVVVHQIVGLEFDNIQGSAGPGRSKTYAPARPEAGAVTEEQGGSLPNAYCTIIINDELIYKTRTKASSSRPIFEAGTERFVRDWRAAVATVTVRDARHRENDPILGVVPLRVADILRSGAGQSTRWYPLDGGIGFGRVRVSLLFCPVALRLPPAQLGFGDVGTFVFLSDTLDASGYVPASSSARVTVRLRTGGSEATLRRSGCTRSASGLSWSLADGNGIDGRLSLPVRYRYRCPVFFELRTSRGSASSSRRAYAVLWLQDLVDGAPTDIDLPLWACDNPRRLAQNYVTEATCHTVPGLGLRPVGRLRFRARFKPGTDRSHRRFVSDHNTRETLETWETCFAEGVRGEEAEVAADQHGDDGDDSISDGSRSDDNRDDNRADSRDGSRDGSRDDSDDDSRDNDDNNDDRTLFSQSPPPTPSSNPIKQLKAYRSRSRDLHRRHRGLMQWKPMRNFQFAKDETTFAVRRIMKVGKLEGRTPDIETEV